ncbi:MAG: choice-of-anchor I family protein [Saprospiraceae bacterium]|nr:choice-of-anchor I family protein [Saprospiraceae bacterium]
MQKKNLLILLLFLFGISCQKNELTNIIAESDHTSSGTLNATSSESINFTLAGSIDLGPTGAAEISAYDPGTKKLFVVNNTNNNNRIDVLDLSNPSSPELLTSISIGRFGGLVNSVSVSEGKLAAGIEASDKVSAGKVVVFNTTTHDVIRELSVGSLPDMVTFTPDGLYILCANEGEPNPDYSIDPPGTISIIDIMQDYTVTTLGFDHFNNTQYQLEARGLRVFGPNATLAQDIEPEHIAVSSNSRTAWVTLQENNAIAQINILAKTITQIFPLGFKNHNLPINAIDPSDQNGGALLSNYPVRGMYEPDGIAVLDYNGNPFLFTANEGDSREYNTYVENIRFGNSNYKLDPAAFPLGTQLKSNNILGRLNVSQAIGDVDNDGDFDQAYTHGARSFTIWNGRNGARIFDSHDDLDRRAIAAGKYPDGRSDDKSIEPEAVVIGKVGDVNLLFVGMERANAVAVYDITDPLNPVYLQWLVTAQAPEGIVFVPADQSPTGKSLLIVSCEGDGVVMVFSTSGNSTF